MLHIAECCWAMKMMLRERCLRTVSLFGTAVVRERCRRARYRTPPSRQANSRCNDRCCDQVRERKLLVFTGSQERTFFAPFCVRKHQLLIVESRVFFLD